MPIPLHAKQLNRSLMRDEVYSTLLRWIMEGELRPGEKLLDSELAEYLGVSRTPVREALKRLEDKALVEASANRWTRVTKITIAAAELIYPIIWTLEELALSTAMPRLTAREFAQMQQANADLARALKSHDPVNASKADARFHGVFIQASKNPYLIDILEDLKIKHRRLEVIYFEGTMCASDSVREHQKVLDALEANDVNGAKARIQNNWTSSLARLRTNPAARSTVDRHSSDDCLRGEL
jgi:DNA-binding GntR family transcriptional regulator